jgi:RNA polymerase sigma factor (sigma-70 family)
MTKDIDIRTNETFTTTNGKTVRYQEIFTGITDEIHRYGFKGGKSMSGEDLKELRQKALIKAFLSRGSYEPEKCHNCPQAYGYKIARKCEIDAFRQSVSFAQRFSPLEEDEIGGEVSGPDRELESSEALSYIQENMDRLEESQRRILELTLQGYKPKKIAKILGCTPNAVSSKLSRTRRVLAKLLGREFLSQYGYRLSA